MTDRLRIKPIDILLKVPIFGAALLAIGRFLQNMFDFDKTVEELKESKWD